MLIGILKVGSLTLVFSAVCKTTRKLAALEEGNCITNLADPLDLPAEVDNFGNVLCVVIGYGISAIVPIARAFKDVGNRIKTIMWVFPLKICSSVRKASIA